MSGEEEKKAEEGSSVVEERDASSVIEDLSHLDEQFPHSNDDLNQSVYNLRYPELIQLLNKLTDKKREQRDVVVFHSYIPMRDSFFESVIRGQFFSEHRKSSDLDGFTLRPRGEWDRYESWSPDHRVCQFYLRSHRYFRVTCQNILDSLRRCLSEKSEKKRRGLMTEAGSLLRTMLGGLGRHSRAEEKRLFPRLQGVFGVDLKALADEHHRMHHLEKQLSEQFERCMRKPTESEQSAEDGSGDPEVLGSTDENIVQSVRLMLLFDRTLFRHLHEEETVVVPMLLSIVKPSHGW